MHKETDPLKAISYFSTSLHLKTSIEEVLWAVTKDIIYKLGFCDCVIYRYDEDRNTLVQSAAFGTKNPSGTTIYNRIEIPFGSGIVGHVAQTKQPLIIEDTTKDDRYIVDDEARRSEICVPILINDKLFGVIDSEHPDVGFYNESHLYILTIVATLCAQRIQDIKAKTKQPLTKENEHYKKLIVLFKEERIYKNPNLSLDCVAEKLGISAGYLSKLINDTTNKSFSQFTNEFRVKESQKKLISKDFAHYNILSIGLESGFNSKASFNRNFKEIVGMPPLTYLKTTKSIAC